MTSDLIRPLTDMYALSTVTVGAALSDLDDAQAGRRTRDGAGSSITFLTGHLLACRCAILQSIGAAEDNPWEETFGGSAAAKDAAHYPPIAELAGQWCEMGQRLGAALTELDEAKILAAGPEWLPVEDRTNRGLLQFMAWHESYHIGQIGLLRVEQGLPSVQSLVHPASLEE